MTFFATADYSSVNWSVGFLRRLRIQGRFVVTGFTIGYDAGIGMELTTSPCRIACLVASVAIRVGGITDMAVTHAVGRWIGTCGSVARVALAGARSLRGVTPFRSWVPCGGLHTMAGKAVGAKLRVKEGRGWSGARPTCNVATCGRAIGGRGKRCVIDSSTGPCRGALVARLTIGHCCVYRCVRTSDGFLRRRTVQTRRIVAIDTTSAD